MTDDRISGTLAAAVTPLRDHGQRGDGSRGLPISLAVRAPRRPLTTEAAAELRVELERLLGPDMFARVQPRASK